MSILEKSPERLLSGFNTSIPLQSVPGKILHFSDGEMKLLGMGLRRQLASENPLGFPTLEAVRVVVATLGLVMPAVLVDAPIQFEPSLLLKLSGVYVEYVPAVIGALIALLQM
jgi:hypothetical protein